MSIRKSYILCAVTLLLAAFPGLASAQAIEETPAFPGAEGWGRYVTGGRGGAVIHVTNLKDRGSGSLRAAIETSGTRTIVFDVSGTIRLKSEMKIKKGNLTIAGQTAPGDGVCVADWPVVIAAPNIIIRFMRFRLGNTFVDRDGDPSTPGHEGDGLGGFDGHDIMVDHCSVSWSVDECLSVYGNDRMTVQWCIISQSLRNAGHTKGAHGYGGNWGGRGATYHHNLLAHHDSRVPRLGDRPYCPDGSVNLRDTTDLRNNVMYNWAGNGCYGGEAMHVNIVDNYYKPGPATRECSTALQYRIAGIGVRSNAAEPAYGIWGKYYVEGNYNPDFPVLFKNNWNYGVVQQVSSRNLNWNAATRDSIHLQRPLHFIKVTTHSAQEAYAKVTAYAGACLHRDSVDKMIVNDVVNGLASHTGTVVGNKGPDRPGFIDTPWDNRPEGTDSASYNPWPELQGGKVLEDTDGDGMPDEWEMAHGLNPSDYRDGAVVASDGYTNLEHYLNGIVDSIMVHENTDGVMEGDSLTVSGTGEGEYTLSNLTHTSKWNFLQGFTMENAENQSYSYTEDYIRFSGNNQNIIKLPEDVVISSVTFTGHAHYATRSSALTELNGTNYAMKYLFNAEGVDSMYTVPLEKAASGEISFTFSPAYVDATVTLHSPVTGISNVRTAEGSKPRDSNIYTLDGRKFMTMKSTSDFHSLPKGVYIYHHHKVIRK